MAGACAYVPDMPVPARVTADQLLYASIPDKRVELVRGELVVREPPGFRHGRVTVDLSARLGAHLRATGARQTLVVESGFKLASDPDTVRGPTSPSSTATASPIPSPSGSRA